MNKPKYVKIRIISPIGIFDSEVAEPIGTGTLSAAEIAEKISNASCYSGAGYMVGRPGSGAIRIPRSVLAQSVVQVLVDGEVFL